MLDADLVKNPKLLSLIGTPSSPRWSIYLGPKAHAVIYAIRQGKQINIVLACPDDLPDDVKSKASGDVEEMRALFEGWDPVLRDALDLVDSVQKWKLLHRKTIRMKQVRKC